jgi:hypothetical protein
MRASFQAVISTLQWRMMIAFHQCRGIISDGIELPLPIMGAKHETDSPRTNTEMHDDRI